MVFNSFGFAGFLAIAFILYWFFFNKRGEAQNLLLLIAGIIFYGFADWRFVFLLGALGLFNYLTARLIINKREGNPRRLVVYSGVIINIGVLLYFKYLNFFVQSFIDFFNYGGGIFEFTPFHILLPVGISFFTFQMIGYLLDVNNEEVEPIADLLSFFTYLFYFPKILSGPIERVQKFLPQIQKSRTFNYSLALEGVWQFAWGLFKKMAVADNCNPVADTIFNNSSDMPGSTLILGSIFYLLGVYADFSGYSDMACGVSKLFGIRITNNFAFPFFSTNISSFWQKWHISLTSWMMDYLFTPMSFVFRSYGRLGLAFSILVTFVVVGLWHGPNWTYVAFGFLQGLYFIPFIVRRGSQRRKTVGIEGHHPSLVEVLKMLGLFLLIALTFILLRSVNLEQAVSIYSEIASATILSLPKLAGQQNTNMILGLVMIIVLNIVEWRNRKYEFALYKIQKEKITHQLLVCFLLTSAIFIFSGNSQEFVYFQF